MRRFGMFLLLILVGLVGSFYWHLSPTLLSPTPLWAKPISEVNVDPVFVGAGDIAGCNTVTKDEETARLLDGIAGTVFTVGDNAYDDGTADEFANCYQPTWGRHKARTKPAPGNHEYHLAGAAGYYGYFGDAATPLEPGCTINCKGYYSYDLGAWHIVVLNSEISVSAGSTQNNWLVADLRANPNVCTLAIFHTPLFSSGQHGSWAGGKPLWNVLYANGVDVILNGHDHNYERFAPQDPNGNLDTARGIRQFIVGMGGRPPQPVLAVQPNSEVRNNDTNGVIKFTLHPTSYEWQFIPIAGETFTDSGSAICVGATGGPTPTNTPIAPTPTKTPIPPTPTNTPIGPTPTPRPTNTPTPIGTPSSLDTIYLSSSSGGTAGGVTFADEDILAYHLNTGAWRKVFDGSVFGLSAVDVDAFDFLPDGSLLLSFDVTATVPGSLRISINDIVKFTPSQPGNYSAGSFSMFLDGSDVGLLGEDENIDAISLATDGRLVISVIGAFSDGALTVKDEDLVVFNGRTGSNSSGGWSFFFDGGDLGMNNASEDVHGAWVSPTNELYLSTIGDYYLQGIITGDENDIFICDPGLLGSRTECDRRIFWDGAAHGFASEQIDDFALGDSHQLFAASLENDPSDVTVDNSVSDDIDNDHQDGDEQGSDDVLTTYLPLAVK